MALLFNDIKIYQISENAISIEFAQDISEETLKIITKINQFIKQNPFSGLQSVIPAYTTLTLYFNLVELMNDAGLKGQTSIEKISGYLKSINLETKDAKKTAGKLIQIPVCYDVKYGLDLEELSSFYQLKKEEIIQLHSSAVYTVYMIGFVPGFPYLGGLSQKLMAPRKQNPRKTIPKGAVGIAGMQTGIYPLETPGGWQIIGRTPIKLFDASKAQPSLLKAGDKIKFEPISISEFERMEKKS